MKNLLMVFIEQEKAKAVASSYSYVCKDCTIKKVVEDRKKKNDDWE